MTARTFAIGDIHGSFVALTTLLSDIKPRADDTLIFLGDYVNRGADSKGVLDTIMALSKQCQVITIMGNHELIMLDGLTYQDDFEFWLKVGGDKTLQSFHLFPRRSECLHLPFNYVNFLKSLQDYHETDDFIFCHASIDSHLPMNQQSDHTLRWRKLENHHTGHISGKTVICGHSEQRNGMILIQGNLICIDTWAYSDGRLSALQVGGNTDDKLTLYQADNSGKSYVSKINFNKNS